MPQLPHAETFFGPRVRATLGQIVLRADALHGEERWQTLAEEIGIPVPFWAAYLYLDGGLLAAPTDTETSTPIAVHVRHGRWLAVCECGSAQHPSFTDPRFFCVQCRNQHVGGRYRTLIWPDRPDEIEQALAERIAARMHWLPHETAADLIEQNELIVAMGI